LAPQLAQNKVAAAASVPHCWQNDIVFLQNQV
jgi:hypothetical protein